MDMMEPTCNECTTNNLSNKKKLGQTDQIVKNRSISKKISPELVVGKIGGKKGQNCVFEKRATKTFIMLFRSPKIYLEPLFNDYLDFGEHSMPNISCNKVGMMKNQLMINVCFLGRSIGP